MAQNVWRYTLTRHEQNLWDVAEMKGWRAAMQAYVEDEAREQGCRKYILYGRKEEILAKGEVRQRTESLPT